METQDQGAVSEGALDALAVAPPPEADDGRDGDGAAHPTTHVRTAHDAGDDGELARDPSDEDAKLDVALDETFPNSDAPSNTQPGKGKADTGDGDRVRAAHDAGTDKALARDPSDENAKLDVALDETFPNSDAPSNTQPGKGKDPAPSSGYDEAAEQARTGG